jgi:hypothetical protein
MKFNDLNKYLGAISWPTVVKIINLLSNFILFYFYYKYLDSEFISSLILSIGILQICYIIIRYGFESIGIVHLIEKKSKFLVTNSIVLKILISFILFTAIQLFLNIYEIKLNFFKECLTILSFSLLAEAFTNEWVLIAKNKFNNYLKLKIPLIILFFTFQIIISIYYQDYNLILFSRLLIFVGAGIISTILIKDEIRISWITIKINYILLIMKKYSKYFFASISSGFLGRINLILLGNGESSIFLKLYDLSFRIVKILEIPFILFQTALLPHITLKKKSVFRTTLMIIFITTIIIIIFNLFFEYFFKFYTSNNAEYNSGLVLLITLILPLSSISSYFGAILFKQKKSNAILFSEIINITSYLLFFIILTNYLSQFHSAIVLSQIIATVTVISYKSFQIKT